MLMLATQLNGVTDELVNTDNLIHLESVVGQYLAELAFANRTDRGHVGYTVLLDYLL